MRKNVGKINLSEVVASPVLSGLPTNYIWTGVVKSENITPHMIADDEQRATFIKIIKAYETEIRNCRTPSVLTAKTKTFEEMSDQEAHIVELGKLIKNWLNNPVEHSMDKDVFWVQLCREYEEILEKNPTEFNPMGNSAKTNLRRFKSFLDSSAPTIRSKYVPEQNRYVCYHFLTREQERKYETGIRENSGKMKKVLESVAGKSELTDIEQRETLKQIVAGISLSDLSILFQDRNFADFHYVNALKNYLLKKEYPPEIIDGMSVRQLKDVTLGFYNNDTVEFHSELITDAISDSIKYIDVEKLLLLSMIRPLESFRLMSPKVEAKEPELLPLKELAEKEKEEQYSSDEYIRQDSSLEDVIEKTSKTESMIKRILSTGIVSPKTVLSTKYGEKTKEYSLKSLDNLMADYCDGIYLTDVVRLNLIYRAYISELGMSNWSDELVQKVGLSDDDKVAISMMNFDNFQRFYKLGMLDKENIRNMLAEIYVDEVAGVLEENTSPEADKRENLIKSNSKQFLKNLYNSRIIDESDIMQYFEEGILTTRMFESLEEDKDSSQLQDFYGKMKKEFSDETLLRSYEQYVRDYLNLTSLQEKNPEDTDEIEKLKSALNISRSEKEKLRGVFNKYNSNISEAERHEIGERLLETYYIDMNISDESVLQETVRVLYEDGLIDLENIIHLDKKYVVPMLDKLSIKDTSKIRQSLNDKELEEMLDGIFEDEAFSDERRFIVIMNLLGEDSEYDKMLREYYISLLDFDDGSERKSKPTGQKRNKGEGSKESKKYIYPDIVKWKFFNALDQDVRATRYANGFVEFASSKLGARIIEKYYDGNSPAYGTATYILSEQDYRANEGELITLTPKGNILESATLREITPRKDRIAHRTQSADKTWMDDMIRYFDIDYERTNDSRYTREELKELKDVIERNKKSYEEIK